MLTWADVDASIHADLSAAVAAQRELRPADVIILGVYAETLPAGPERDRVTGILARQAPLTPEEAQAGMVRAGNVLNLDGSLGDFGRLQVGSILSRVR